MSCLLTEATIEQEGEADSLGEGNPSFLFRSEESEASGFVLSFGGDGVPGWRLGTKA